MHVCWSADGVDCEVSSKPAYWIQNSTADDCDLDVPRTARGKGGDTFWSWTASSLFAMSRIKRLSRIIFYTIEGVVAQDFCISHK